MLTPSQNSLFGEQTVRTVNIDRVESPVSLIRPRRNAVREFKELRRKQSAAESIAGLTRDNEIYGFTKGQFSLLDLLLAVLDRIGPADVSISTWTAARKEIITLDELMKAGRIRSMRWLVDFTFARRDPEAAQQIRKTFGVEAIRVAQNHAKFLVFRNAEWQAVIRTSMNLNMNPRFEDFTLAHDPELADFLSAILDEIWHKQKRTLADATPPEMRRHFRDKQ